MTGYSTIVKVRRVEEFANSLGFMFAYPKHQGSFGERDTLGLRPKDNDSLPIYTRDAELFSGSLHEIECFLNGIKWAREYDYMLKVADNKKRERKEQDYRNRRLMETLRSGDPEKVPEDV
jgi:hypothetical protein